MQLPTTPPDYTKITEETITNVLDIVSRCTITVEVKDLPAINIELGKLQQLGNGLREGTLAVVPVTDDEESDNDDTDDA